MRITRRRQLEASEGDLTPMIDMTFQLIAFFMVLINFTEVEQDQRITLPASELAQPPDVPYDEPLTIQITKDETILFARDELEPDALLPALRREAAIIKAYGETKKLSEVTVIIRADETVRTGVVQEAISACQEAEFETFALRGKTSDENTLIMRE
ncbi:biopolymer transport protein ExbD [Posidoniimonas polymericola]|uniref:Biopolymer transport protein ExbD n=1 Tax=Posidoniimonas polymericola TaxID=2528002 RepID=A0A5C5YDA2_9BACT|nr:biopolymer transporter ExbD [Posidoniimonas polymericola]TWT72763.1 biopolymer transport protein ExbD [Posidoniimonas polymericola]